jgi:hypothetical protein
VNNELIKQYVCLADRKKELDAEAKIAAHDLKLLGERVIDEIHNAGFEKVTVDGRTVSIKEDIFVSTRGDDDELVAALKAADLAQYVAPESYNRTSIEKYVRELWKDLRGGGKKANLVTEQDLRMELPMAVSALLSIAFVYKISNTQA